MEPRQAIELDHLSDRDLLVLTVQGVNEVKGTLMKQDDRIRSLEQWRWFISGGLAVLITLVSINKLIL